MQELKLPLIETKDGPIELTNNWEWEYAREVWLIAFTYLTPFELSKCAQTSKCWYWCAYDSSLWTSLDLSAYGASINDNTLAVLLSHTRFQHLLVLNLELCTEITDKTLQLLYDKCPNLRSLFLTHCCRLSALGIYQLVSHLPFLHRLELFHTCSDPRIIGMCKNFSPQLDLGYAWLWYCAEMNVRVNGDLSSFPSCFFAQEEGGGEGEVERGGDGLRCHGRIRGQVIYSNLCCSKPGSFPSEVIFACDVHATNYNNLLHLNKCRLCGLWFREESMGILSLDRMCCRTCCDRILLENKNSWISLDAQKLRDFNYSDVLRAVKLFDTKNLPLKLRKYGSVKCELSLQRQVEEKGEEGPGAEEGEQRDRRGGREEKKGSREYMRGLGEREIELTEEKKDISEERRRGRNSRRQVSLTYNEEEEEEDEEKKEAKEEEEGEEEEDLVPLRYFIEVNRTRVTEQVQALLDTLIRASEKGEQRALLCYNEEKDIEVLADGRLMIGGLHGSYIQAFSSASFRYASYIIGCLFLFLLSVLCTSNYFRKNEKELSINALFLPLSFSHRSPSLLPRIFPWFVVLGIVLGASIGMLVCLASLYRWHRGIYHKAVHALTAIGCVLYYLVGGCLCLIGIGKIIPLEAPSCVFMLWNFVILAMTALYHAHSFVGLHAFFYLLLHGLVAALTLLIFGQWVAIILVWIALVDLFYQIYAERLMARRNAFLLPRRLTARHRSRPETTVFFVSGLAVTADVGAAFYGLLVGEGALVGGADIYSGLSAFVTVLACIVGAVFVSPFLGNRMRPLVLTSVAVLAVALTQPISTQFVVAQNFLNSTSKKLT